MDNMTPLRWLIVIAIAIPFTAILMIGIISLLSWFLLGPFWLLLGAIAEGDFFDLILAILFLISPVGLYVCVEMLDKYIWLSQETIMCIALLEFMAGMLVLTVCGRVIL